MVVQKIPLERGTKDSNRMIYSLIHGVSPKLGSAANAPELTDITITIAKTAATEICSLNKTNKAIQQAS